MDIIWYTYPALFVLIFLFIAVAELFPKKIEIIKPPKEQESIFKKIDSLEKLTRSQSQMIQKLETEATLHKNFAKNLQQKISVEGKEKINITHPKIENQSQDLSQNLSQKIRNLKIIIESKNQSIESLERKVMSSEDIATAYLKQIKSLKEILGRQEDLIIKMENQILLKAQQIQKVSQPQKKVAHLMHTFRDQLQELRKENTNLSELNTRLVEENSLLKNSQFI
ncbi:MAG: hypothetical protein KDD50_14905 [Bdellovibrionales bacterium]|nr:hypothetical protein [Bdellovibrionales bacterium]